ncbi:Uma2 family endonuclease [Promineifilum sp.]|uniref:Uma2 family endonuclease n=1 Tax=Promineifilum sp. TaxID=2664178 RepID=UPI0035AEF136
MESVPLVRDKHAHRERLSYEEYLALPDDGRIVEWVDGKIIEHMPTTPSHQRIVAFLLSLLRAYVFRLQLGEVLLAPMEVKLWPGGPSREPDVLFIGRARLSGLTERRFEGAPDLVVEVISPGSVTLDRIDKFREYEQAGVGEYWIIDPRPHQEQADFYVRDAEGRFVPAPLSDDGVYASTVVPGFRLRVAWLWPAEPEAKLPDIDLALAWMLADAPGVSDELRALYREMLRLLSE